MYITDLTGKRLRSWRTLDTGWRGGCVAIAVDESQVFVANWVQIEVYREDGSRMRVWGKQGKRHGEFDGALSLQVRRNKVHVADVWNDRVQVFTRNGDFLSTFQVPRPCAVEVTLELILVMSESRIFIFDPEGIELHVVEHSLPLGGLLVSDGGLWFSFGLCDDACRCDPTRERPHCCIVCGTLDGNLLWQRPSQHAITGIAARKHELFLLGSGWTVQAAIKI